MVYYLVKDLIEQHGKNGLVKNMSGWITYRQAGDYNAWNGFQPKSGDWTETDEINTITFLLEQVLKRSKFKF